MNILQNGYPERNVEEYGTSQELLYSWRGKLTSPEFANPLDTSITEKNISGEAIELLRTVAQKEHPDLKDGQVVQMGHSQDAEIKNALGSFGLTKQNGKYIVFDTYDFSPLQSIGFLDAVQMSAEDKSPYMVARYLGGKLMPENPDGSSRRRCHASAHRNPQRGRHH